MSQAIAGDRFKSVITGDLLDVRGIYRRAFMFRPQAQHVYAGNMLPSFRGGMDAGVKRRLIVIECLRVIPPGERVPHIGKRIAQEEGDLLLAWAIEGAQRVLRNHGFSEPESSKRLLAEWTRTANPEAAWFEDRRAFPVLKVVGEKPPRTSSRDAFEDFRVWHMAEEGRPTLFTQKTFTERLKGMLPEGYGIARRTASAGLRGCS